MHLYIMVYASRMLQVLHALSDIYIEKKNKQYLTQAVGASQFITCLQRMPSRNMHSAY